jgi:hypothetical protein
MMHPSEVRCPAAHPTVPAWACNARLYAAVPGSVVIHERKNGIPHGCLHLVCPRCGTEYVVCPADRAA